MALLFAGGAGHFTVTDGVSGNVDYYPKNSYEIKVKGDLINIEDTGKDTFIIRNQDFSVIDNAGATALLKAAAVAAIIYA